MVLHVVLTVLAFKNINALIIKFANTCIWPGRTLDVVVRSLKISFESTYHFCKKGVYKVM